MGLFSRWFKRVKKEDQELLQALSSNDEKALELIRNKPSKEQQVLMLQAGFHEMVALVQSIRANMDQQVDLQQKLLDSMEHLPSAVEGLGQIGKATELQTEALGQFNSTLASMESANRQSMDMIMTMMTRSESRMMKLVIFLVILSLVLLGSGMYFGLRGFNAASSGDRVEAPASQPPVVDGNAVPEEVSPPEDHAVMALPSVESEDESMPAEADEFLADETIAKEADAVPAASSQPDGQQFEADEPPAEETAVVAAPSAETITDEVLPDEGVTAEDPADEVMRVEEGVDAGEDDLSGEETTDPSPESEPEPVQEAEELPSPKEAGQYPMRGTASPESLPI